MTEATRQLSNKFNLARVPPRPELQQTHRRLLLTQITEDLQTHTHTHTVCEATGAQLPNTDTDHISEKLSRDRVQVFLLEQLKSVNARAHTHTSLSHLLKA